MNGKKRIVVLLVMLLIASSFAGCGQGTAPAATTAQNATTVAATTVAATTEPAASGEKIKVNFFAGDYDNIVENGFLEKFIEEKIPDVDISWTRQGPDLIEQVNLAIAAGNPPDMWWGISADGLQKLYDEKLIRSIPDETLSSIFPGYINYIKKASPNMKDQFVYVRRDGKIYGLPALWTIGPYSQGLGVRKDWMDNVGITKYPETLVEYEAMLKAFTENDPDKDGVKNTFGLTGYINDDNGGLLTCLSFVFGAYGTFPGIFTEKDKKIVMGEIEPGTKDALKLLKSWYEKGYLDPEFMVNKQTNMDEKVFANRVGSLVSDWFNFFPAEAFWSGQYLSGLKDKGAVWYNIVAPKGPSGAQGLTQRAPMSHIAVFSEKVSDKVLEKYLQVMQLTTFDPEGLLAYNKGKEGVTFKRREGGGYDWLPPYDQEAKRIEFGLGVNKDTYNAGGFFNDYDLQFEYMTAPEYIQLRKDAESRNIGKVNILDQVVLNKYNEFKQPLDQLATGAFIDFITGKRDLGEFDAFVQEWLKLGGQEVLDEAQKVYDQYNK
jgi:putative aldouronate transport system substrate-binding protein